MELTACRNPVEFSKILHMERENRLQHYRLEIDWLATSCAEKDLGILVNIKLNVSQQCAPATKQAYCLLGSIHHSIAN